MNNYIYSDVEIVYTAPLVLFNKLLLMLHRDILFCMRGNFPTSTQKIPLVNFI